MVHGTDDRIGARIASYRKLAGYTQREFAEIAYLSLGSVRKVERGERLPTHGYLIASARTLGVSVEELSGQPFRGESQPNERVHAPIQGIRAAVRHYDLPADWYSRSRSLRELTSDVRTASEHRAAARYARLGAMLPGLLEELASAVHLTTGSEKKCAARLLASSYYMAHGLALRLGYRDLIGQLEDRMRWAADLSHDPLMRALAEWTRSYSFDAFGDYNGGLRVLAAARQELMEAQPAPTPERLTLIGSLHLRESTIASLARNKDAMKYHIIKASGIAEELPGREDHLHYHMTFGSVNVVVHDVAALVELKRPAEAVKKAEGLQFPKGMARTRQGHHYVAVARAYLDLDRKDESLRHLKKARKIAPEQTKFHPTARETARLLTTKYRRTTEELRSMSSWFGVGT
ncbi:helix-turn-helix domain-containing protein [Streptomyces sp. NPDC091377]|uniref:helix-turn-helix domain-containing protein n=1 Tax=unclassified Streptomyces TaxID=2593676 RepID=UPI0037F4CE58